MNRKHASKRFRLQPKRVTEWALALAAALGAIKLLIEIIKMLNS